MIKIGPKQIIFVHEHGTLRLSLTRSELMKTAKESRVAMVIKRLESILGCTIDIGDDLEYELYNKLSKIREPNADRGRRAMLTAEQVEHIRLAYHNTSMSMAAIARSHNISPTLVNHVISRIGPYGRPPFDNIQTTH